MLKHLENTDSLSDLHTVKWHWLTYWLTYCYMTPNHWLTDCNTAKWHRLTDWHTVKWLTDRYEVSLAFKQGNKVIVVPIYCKPSVFIYLKKYRYILQLNIISNLFLIIQADMLHISLFSNSICVLWQKQNPWKGMDKDQQTYNTKVLQI